MEGLCLALGSHAVPPEKEAFLRCGVAARDCRDSAPASAEGSGNGVNEQDSGGFQWEKRNHRILNVDQIKLNEDSLLKCRKLLKCRNNKHTSEGKGLKIINIKIYLNLTVKIFKSN